MSRTERPYASLTVRRDVFGAIADGTRREILTALGAARRGGDGSESGERTMSEIAGRFAMTLPAVSQHLRVLLDAGLVTVRRVGRERRYRLNAAPLKEVSAWVGEYEMFWDEKIAALSAYLDETAVENGEEALMEARKAAETPKGSKTPGP